MDLVTETADTPRQWGKRRAITETNAKEFHCPERRIERGNCKPHGNVQTNMTDVLPGGVASLL